MSGEGFIPNLYGDRTLAIVVVYSVLPRPYNGICALGIECDRNAKLIQT